VGCKGAVGLRSSERVNDLANLIGKHLSRFLCVPSSPEPGVIIWYTLVWLTGAWCTALVVLRRSKSGKVGAAAALVAAVVTDGASSYLEKLLITFMGALTPVETALQAPNEDAALQHRGGAKNRTLGPDDHGSPRFAPNFALHAPNHCFLDAYCQGRLPRRALRRAPRAPPPAARARAPEARCRPRPAPPPARPPRTRTRPPRRAGRAAAPRPRRPPALCGLRQLRLRPERATPFAATPSAGYASCGYAQCGLRQLRLRPGRATPVAASP